MKQRQQQQQSLQSPLSVSISAVCSTCRFWDSPTSGTLFDLRMGRCRRIRQPLRFDPKEMAALLLQPHREVDDVTREVIDTGELIELRTYALFGCSLWREVEVEVGVEVERKE